MGKKAKIISVILSLIVVGLVAFIITDKLLLNREEDDDDTGRKSSRNSVNNTIDNTIDNTIENTISKKEKNEIIETPTKVEPKYTEEVKKALKDANWLGNNVLVNEEENDSTVEIGNQVVNFIVCKSTNNIPIVVIKVEAEDIRFSKIVLVTYSESEHKVVATKINQGHIYHGAYTVDANKCVVKSLYMHGGSSATIYHSVANGKLTFMGKYGTEDVYGEDEYAEKYFISKTSMYTDPEYVSESEYESYKASLKESQYNFVEIGTPLTNTNIDTYIK